MVTFYKVKFASAFLATNYNGGASEDFFRQNEKGTN